MANRGRASDSAKTGRILASPRFAHYVLHARGLEGGEDARVAKSASIRSSYFRIALRNADKPRIAAVSRKYAEPGSGTEDEAPKGSALSRAKAKSSTVIGPPWKSSTSLMTLGSKANAMKLPGGAVNVIPEERSTRLLLASNVLMWGGKATLPPCGFVHHPNREIG